MNIATTKEQSKRLLELGFKKETADMVYQAVGLTPYNVWYKSEIENDFFPAWSLSTLMEMLPKSIRYNDLIHYMEIQTDEECYDIEYHIFDGEREWYLSGGYDKDIFEAIIETFEILLQKEIIKVEDLTI